MSALPDSAACAETLPEDTPPTHLPQASNLAADVATLQLFVESFYDTQKLRIQVGNRISAIERAGGVALPALVAGFDALAKIEHSYELEIKREWRKHPLAPWAKGIRGVGELTAAKIVSLCGGSATQRADGTPRSVRQLYSYAGVGDPARRRRRGMTQEDALACGNIALRKELWLATSLMLRTGNREEYDYWRDVYATREEWSDGRRHNAALRAVGKSLLKSMWVYEKALA